MPHMNEYNKKLAEQGWKRRAKLLKANLAGKTPKQLAEKYNISASRIRLLLKKAKLDNV